MATFLLVLIVVFANLFSLALIATVVYDLVAIRYGWRTVSEETYRLGKKFPVVTLVTTALICLAVGMLLGHLFLGQTIVVQG